MSDSDRPALDWRHSSAEVPAGGLRVSRSATPEERERVRALLDILEVPSLAVTYQVEVTGRRRDDGDRASTARVTGRLTAEVVQACVATLEPVAQTIDEAIEVMLVPEDEIEAALGDDLLAGPDVEPFGPGGVIPVGRIVYEVLGTALDPAPRAAGADVRWSDAETGDARPSPFAALARLRQAPGSDVADD